MPAMKVEPARCRMTMMTFAINCDFSNLHNAARPFSWSFLSQVYLVLHSSMNLILKKKMMVNGAIGRVPFRC